MTYYNYLGTCFPSTFSTLRLHHFLHNRDKLKLGNKAELQFSSLQLSLQALHSEGAAVKGWQHKNHPWGALECRYGFGAGEGGQCFLIKPNPA